MSAAPPSYDQDVGGGGLYPQVPEKGGPPPANYNPPGATVWRTNDPTCLEIFDVLLDLNIESHGGRGLDDCQLYFTLTNLQHPGSKVLVYRLGRDFILAL